MQNLQPCCGGLSRKSKSMFLRFILELHVTYYLTFWVLPIHSVNLVEFSVMGRKWLRANTFVYRPNQHLPIAIA